MALELYHFRSERIDSPYLDCASVNQAVLLDAAGVHDIRTPFACQWHFSFNPTQPDEIPELQRFRTVDVIRQITGCSLVALDVVPGESLSWWKRLLREHRAVLVYGDAWDMPWLPYHKKEHLEHTFVLCAVDEVLRSMRIVDAYANQTEWGRATPTETTISGSELDRIVRSYESSRFVVVRREDMEKSADIPGWLTGNAERILSAFRDGDMLGRFRQHYASKMTDVPAVRQFVLACWLVARSRALHGLWLSGLDRGSGGFLQLFADRFHQQACVPWQRVSELAYVSFRRIRQGGSPILSCLDLLETIQRQEAGLAELLSHKARTELGGR